MSMRNVASVLACLGLGACFTSPTPLIAPEQAEFPVATPVEIASLRADGSSLPLRLDRRGDMYVLVDPHAKKDGQPAIEEVKHRFVVRGIGDGLYVAQRYPDSGVAACPCMFGLVEMKGKRVEVYDFDAFGSSQQLNAEEMARYGVTVEEDTYRLSSFDKTAALFRLLLERPRPDDVYEVK